MTRLGVALAAIAAVAAALGSAALFLWLAEGTNDPIRAMVCLLPIVAGLTRIAEHTTRQAESARVSPIESALWLGWIALALGHERLGLDDTATLVAMAGFVLAAVRITKIARALARASEDRPRVFAGNLLAAFAGALALFLFLWPWSTAGRAPDGDEPYNLLLTKSLAADFDVDLANQYREHQSREWSATALAPQPGDPVGAGGESWSRHAAFLPLLLSPLYAIGGWRAAEIGMLLFAAALAAASFALLLRRGPRATGANGASEIAARGWAIVLLLPPLFIYSGRFWVEVPAALAVAVALLAMPGATERATHRPRARAGLLLVAALIFLPLLKLRFLLLAVPLAALAWMRLGPDQRKLRRQILAGTAIAAAALLVWNSVRFGHPLRMYRFAELDLTNIPLAQFAAGFVGLFFDVAYGLFATAPLWLLLLPAFAEGARRRRLPVGELLAVAPYLAYVASRREWYGGWSPPFRYGLVLLPVLLLVLSPLLEVRPRRAAFRIATSTLVSASAVLALILFARPAWTFSLADGSNRILSELTVLFPVDLVRFTPSTVRPRVATWLWLGAAALLLLLLRRASAAARRFLPALPLGVSLLLAGAGAWFVAAAHVPTSIVELEDGWVTKRGGALRPERWTVDRTSQTGGWTVADGAEIRFAPVRGGERCRLRLYGYYRGDLDVPLELEVRANDVVAARISPAEFDAWVTIPTPWFELPAQGEIEIRAVRPVAPDDGSDREARRIPLWILDRLEIDWS